LSKGSRPRSKICLPRRLAECDEQVARPGKVRLENCRIGRLADDHFGAVAPGPRRRSSHLRLQKSGFALELLPDIPADPAIADEHGVPVNESGSGLRDRVCTIPAQLRTAAATRRASRSATANRNGLTRMQMIEVATIKSARFADDAERERQTNQDERNSPICAKPRPSSGAVSISWRNTSRTMVTATVD